jgi:hypothetical protein
MSKFVSRANSPRSRRELDPSFVQPQAGPPRFPPPSGRSFRGGGAGAVSFDVGFGGSRRFSAPFLALCIRCCLRRFGDTRSRHLFRNSGHNRFVGCRSSFLGLCLLLTHPPVFRLGYRAVRPKMYSIADAISRLAGDRQPLDLFAKIGRASAHFRKHFAEIFVMDCGFGDVWRRARRCAADFLLCGEAVRAERAFRASTVHQRPPQADHVFLNRVQIIQRLL